MRSCGRCQGPVQASYRFCPWCAAPQRLKLVEFFRPHPRVRADAARSLRVSRYLGPVVEDRHVRFSVWNAVGERAEAEAAVSLAEDEAARLARFIAQPEAGGVHALLDWLYRRCKCSDRFGRRFQTDARADPPRPDVGAASGASGGLRSLLDRLYARSRS
jgi:hypothetical protein